MKKRFLPLLLFLFLLPTLFVVSVNAGVLYQGSWGTNLSWVLTDDGTLTLSGEGKMEDGRYASNLPIGGPWVSAWKTVIRRVVVEEGLTTIGKYAFYSCSALTEVNLPSSITSIEEGAFRECTALGSLTIPAGVRSIHHTAFNQCTALRNIYVSGANRYFSSRDGILCNKDGTALLIFPYCHGNSDTVTIPEGITEIGDNAFYENKRLVAVNFPSTLKKINGQCFYSCSYLKNLELPYGVEYIGYSAFRYCDSLTSVRIPSSVTEMNSYVFGSCKLLTYASFDDGIEKIPDSIFYVCKNLETVYIPGTVTWIDTSAFSGCDNLKDVYFGGSEWDWGNIIFRNFNDVLNYSWVNRHFETGLADICSGELTLSQTNYVYDGKAKRPGVTVTLNGERIFDFTVTYLHNVEPGTANVIATGVGSYTGTLWGSFTIEAAPVPASTPSSSGSNSGTSSKSNTGSSSVSNSGSSVDNRKAANMKIKAKNVKVKYSKKKRSFSWKKAFKIRNAKGTLSFQKVYGSKGISINRKGKITIKKKMRRGEHYMMVRIASSGNAQYKPDYDFVYLRIYVK